MNDPPRDLELEQLDEIEQALESLGNEIRSRFVERERRPAPWEEVDWARLYDGLRRRLAQIGVSERSGEVDEFGMDDAVLERAQPLFDLLYDVWWRVDTAGLEALPAQGPCLLVANRSGLLPYDGLVLSYAVQRFHTHGERPRFL